MRLSYMFCSMRQIIQDTKVTYGPLLSLFANSHVSEVFSMAILGCPAATSPLNTDATSRQLHTHS
jgi:hypothetical protein